MLLAVDFDEHLIEMPAPVSEAPHPVDTLTPDLASEQGAEPAPPQPHRFVASIDSALEKQVLDVTQ